MFIFMNLNFRYWFYIQCLSQHLLHKKNVWNCLYSKRNVHNSIWNIPSCMHNNFSYLLLSLTRKSSLISIIFLGSIEHRNVLASLTQDNLALKNQWPYKRAGLMPFYVIQFSQGSSFMIYWSLGTKLLFSSFVLNKKWLLDEM